MRAEFVWIFGAPAAAGIWEKFLMNQEIVRTCREGLLRTVPTYSLASVAPKKIAPKMRALVVVPLLVFFQTTSFATELVIREDVTIQAQKDGALISISSGKGFDRSYAWDGCTLKSNMGARAQRWYGSLGIFDPAPSFGFSFSPSGCAGISRTVVEEGQIHFDNMRFVQEWIRRQPSSYKTVWTNDGLLVSWATVPKRAQLNVNVWLVCIDGKRPTQLDGAIDSAIRVTKNSRGQSIHDCAAVGKEIVDQTRSQLEAEWKARDEWIARYKEYEKRQQKK